MKGKVRKAVNVEKLEMHRSNGADIRDVILGGQDGIVNVLGLVLGVASAIPSTQIVIISGLAATFAESISMAAVAYTSSRAVNDAYKAEYEREEREVRDVPEMEREEIREIYRQKGFKGRDLEKIVKVITSNKKVWIDTMMSEELHLYKAENANPWRVAGVVGFSSLIGSFIPLLPFFLFPIQQAIWWAIGFATLVLFAGGFVKAKLTTGNALRSGLEIVIVGMVAAIAGYLIGSFLGANPALTG